MDVTRRRRAHPPLTVAGLLILFAHFSHADSYIRLKPTSLKTIHTHVFLGTVDSIWKGVPRRERFLVIERVDRWGPPQLVPGGTFLFYADSTDAGFVVHWTALRKLSDATEDLAALGKPTIVQRIPGLKR